MAMSGACISLPLRPRMKVAETSDKIDWKVLGTSDKKYAGLGSESCQIRTLNAC